MRLTDKVVKEKKLTTMMVTHNLRYAVEYGNRLVMMHEGMRSSTRQGKRKQSFPWTMLDEFNQISIEWETDPKTEKSAEI